MLVIQRSLNVLSNSKCSNKNFDWKAITQRPMQSVCLKYAAEQNDIIVSLPTGYGKSLLLEVLPYIKKVFNKREPSIALIVMPLNAIIDDQLHKLGDDCVRVNPAAIGDVALLSGKKYILGHPETILDDRMHDTLLSLTQHVG